MIKKISMLAVLAAAFAVVLAGCVKAPASPITGSLEGTWSFEPFPVSATITGNAVMVTATIVPGTTDPTDTRFASVTQLVVNATLTEDAEEETFTLTLVDGDTAVIPMLTPGLSPQAHADRLVIVSTAIRTMIEGIQDKTFMIKLDTSGEPDTMTLTGSFIVALLTELGAMVPPDGLPASRVG